MEANAQTRIARTEALFRSASERIAVSAERFGRRCSALVEKVKPLARRTVLRLDPRIAQNA
jgi:hypothetical protein